MAHEQNKNINKDRKYRKEPELSNKMNKMKVERSTS